MEQPNCEDNFLRRILLLFSSPSLLLQKIVTSNPNQKILPPTIKKTRQFSVLQSLVCFFPGHSGLKERDIFKISIQNKKEMNIANIQIKGIEQLLSQRSKLINYLTPIGLADAAVYHYVKEGSFFSKKEERLIFYFFSGLNTNPQNLSIFLRDQVQLENKNSKEKLIKGQFIVYDIFNRNDCVVEISIPGNFQIYKIHNGKKELISNSEIDMMYMSSTIRSMYQRNISWGRCYSLFSSRSMIAEFKSFLDVFVKIVQKNDIFISDDFENKSNIKGSHLCSILFHYIKFQGVTHHTVEFLEAHAKNLGGYAQIQPKIAILLSELYNSDSKHAKSLSIVGALLSKYPSDPYVLYYQAKYMFKLMAIHESLIIVNSIVQYNQFEIWILTAEIHTELKNYSEALVCLNHASKVKGTKNNPKNIDAIYQQFNYLGKNNSLSQFDEITFKPKMMVASENPLPLINLVQNKYKSMIESDYWKLDEGMKIICHHMRTIRYRLQGKKFQQLLESTFEEQKKQFNPILFKKGMTQSMFEPEIKQKNEAESSGMKESRYEEELPHFLQDESVEVEIEEVAKGGRNLSIIPQLESVIQNSQFEEKQKQTHKISTIKLKKELSENLLRILKVILSEGEYQRAEHEENWAKILPVYNKLRSLSKTNNYYTNKMFEILIKVENYKSIIVLIAETLDFLEQNGNKKIQNLPFWMNKYILVIIEEKGLKFLNNMLEKMKFLDEAVLDTIELAKSWKIKGCTF